LLDINIHKTFTAAKRTSQIIFNAKIELGAVTAIFGQSGVGKSTVLRIISGLEKADKGHLVFDSITWFNDTEYTSVSDRKVGFVFQDFNLFPNMTVEGNLKYASPNNEIDSTIKDILKVANLDGLLVSYPHELSGGEKQRVSIVRALCQNSKLLLLDEPFSALDDEAIALIVEQLKIIQDKINTTIIIVSHRVDVILYMATSVVVMKTDLTCEQGKPSELLTKRF